MKEDSGRYRRCRKKKKGGGVGPEKKEGAKAPGDVFELWSISLMIFILMLVGVPPWTLVYFGAAVDVGMPFWREVGFLGVRRNL